MKIKDLEIYLLGQQNEFYQFAMVLTADHDISEKIIQDSVYLLLSEEKEDIASLLKNNNNPQTFFSFSRIFIFKSLYRIAKSNNLFQMPIGSKRAGVLEQNAFWPLPMDQRAVLFLRQKLKQGKDNIGEILSITKVEYFNILNLGREQLLKNAGSLSSNLAETF